MDKTNYDDFDWEKYKIDNSIGNTTNRRRISENTNRKSFEDKVTDSEVKTKKRDNLMDSIFVDFSDDIYRRCSSENTETKSFRDEVLNSTNHEAEARKRVDEVIKSLLADLYDKNISKIKDLIKERAAAKDYKVIHGNKVIHGTTLMRTFAKTKFLNENLRREVAVYANEKNYPGLLCEYNQIHETFYIDLDPSAETVQTGYFHGYVKFTVSRYAKDMLNRLTEELKKEGIYIEYQFVVNGKKETYIINDNDIIKSSLMSLKYLKSTDIKITYDYTF